MSSIGNIVLDLNVNSKGFNRQVNDIGKTAKKQFTSMSIAIGNIMGNMIQKAVSGIGSFVKDSIDKGSELAELQNVVDSVFTTMSDKVNNFAKNALQAYGLTESQAKRMMGTYGAMSKSFGYTEKQAYSMSEQLTALTADVASFYNLDHDQAYTKMKSVFTGETESLKELGVVMTQTALDQFAMQNGFGKTTKNMNEQEKVALRLAFVQDKLNVAAGDFTRTADSWANQTRILTGQFASLKAAIGQGLINALTPVIKVINTIMAKLVQLANMFNSFVGALSGKGKENANAGMKQIADAASEAAGAASDMEGSAGGTAKSAKKIQKALMGFDEINKLPDKVDSSGGGGGGGGGAGSEFDFGDLGLDSMDSVIDESLSSMAEKIKEAWKNADFTDIGMDIGTSLKKGLEKIKWEPIKEGCYKVAKSVATLLNGFFAAPDLFTTIGHTIAELLNSAISLALGFVENFDFKGFGKALSDGVDGFFKTFNFSGAAQAISGWYRGSLQAAASFLKQTDFNVVGKKIGEFLKNIDTAGLVADFAKLIWEVIKAAFKLSASLIVEAPIETVLLGVFATFKFTKLGTLLAKKIGSAIAGTAFVTSLKASLSSAFASLPTLLASDISLLGAATAGEIALSIVAGLGGAIVAAFAGWKLGKWLNEHTIIGDFADKLVEGVAKAVKAVGKLFKSIGKLFSNIWGGIKEDISTVLEIITSVITGTWSSILSFFDMILNGIKGVVSSIWNSIKSIITTILYTISSIISSIWNGIKNIISTIINAIKTGISNVFNAIKTTITNIFDNVKSFITNTWENIKEKILNILENIKNGISNAFNVIKSGVTNKVTEIKNGIVNAFQTAYDKVTGLFNNLGVFFGGVWSKIKNTFTNLGTKISEAISGAVKAGVNGVFGTIEKIVNGFISAINGAISVINAIPGVSISKLNKIDIPALAQGGYVKKNQPMPVIVGDNKTQGEIISPEGKMRDVMLEALESFFNKLMSMGFNQGQRAEAAGDIVIPIYLDGMLLDEVIVTAQQRKDLRSGGR